MKKSFYSNGKLLLTGEYVVLDGATALAIPTKKGQTLTVSATEVEGIKWRSIDATENCWFEAHIDLNKPTSKSNNPVEHTLKTILKQAKQLNSDFLTDAVGYQVETTLSFPRDWGLGSSSTLINNIAQWAKVDAFALLHQSFGGSGYDIAAAQHNKAIFYQIKDSTPTTQEVTLPWDFTNQLFFVHRNKKQDSKEGISKYKEARPSQKEIEQISDLTRKMLLCYSINDFEQLLMAHERIISSIIGLPTVKDLLFPDFSGTVKSLGAWGGDFVLATGPIDTMEYFREKGYTTIIPFTEMSL